jgi:hypothetical protein
VKILLSSNTLSIVIFFEMKNDFFNVLNLINKNLKYP